MRYHTFSEDQNIPEDCRERFIHFGSCTSRAWPGQDIDVSGLSLVGKDYDIHRFPAVDHVVLYVRSGALHLTGHGDIAADMIGFLPANSEHEYQADAPTQLVWFHLNPESTSWAALQSQARFVRPSLWGGTLWNLMEMLYVESMLPGGVDTIMENQISRIILQYLRRDLVANAADDATANRVRGAFYVMEQSLDRPWTLAELAKECGMSIPNLFLVTRRLYGKAPGTMLNDMRMSLATKLLRLSDYKLDEIARQTGFSCGYSFSRAFVKYYGVAPGRWRVANRAHS